MATFEFVPQGLRVDGHLIICEVAFGGSSGELRRDSQDRQGGVVVDAGTGAGDGEVVGSSAKSWIWTGWEARRASVDLLLTGPTREADLRLLIAASRGTTPQEHRLVGDRTGGAFDSPVVIDSIEWDWPHTPDECTVQLEFEELDPEIVGARTAPQPQPARQETPTPPADPDDVIGTDNLSRLDELERQLRLGAP